MENTDRIQAFLKRCRKLNISVNAVCIRANRNPNNITRWRSGQNEPAPSRFNGYMDAVELALCEIERESFLYLAALFFPPKDVKQLSGLIDAAASKGVSPSHQARPAA